MGYIIPGILVIKMKEIRNRLIQHHLKYILIGELLKDCKVLYNGCGDCAPLNKFKTIRSDLVFSVH